MKIILSLLLTYWAFTNIYSQSYEWRVIGEMQNPVWGAQAVNDPSSTQYQKIYVLGGYSYTEQDTVTWIQECHIPTNTWQIVGSMQQPRQNFVADIWKSSVLYFGGNNKFEKVKGNLEAWVFKPAFSQPQVYDVDSNFVRSSSTGYVNGDNLYIVGGDPTEGSTYINLPFIVEYNLSTQQFGFTFDYTSSEKPGNHMSFIIGDNIYIFGGVKSGVAGTLLKTISRFNIKTRELEELATKLPEPRAEGAAVYNSIINKGFIIGGHDENRKPLSTVWQVTINDDGSMEIRDDFPSLNYARRGCMAVNYGSFIAVLGGKDADGNVVPYVEVLDAVTTSSEGSNVPASFSLSQNHPNPFNPSTILNYQISEESFVTLKVYDILGREVAVLVDEAKSPGNYSVTFNPSDISQSGASSGTYFYRLTAGNFSETKKMILMK